MPTIQKEFYGTVFKEAFFFFSGTSTIDLSSFTMSAFSIEWYAVVPNRVTRERHESVPLELSRAISNLRIQDYQQLYLAEADYFRCPNIRC